MHPRLSLDANFDDRISVFLSAVVNMLIKQIIITGGIPFEVKMGRPVYSVEETVNEVRATMAFEDMELTDGNVTTETLAESSVTAANCFVYKIE